MADQGRYAHGEMKIDAQEHVFDRFVTLSTKVAVFCLVIVAGLAVFGT